MPRVLPLSLLVLAACAPEPRDGVLTGIVTRGPGTDAPREAGATVRTFDNTDTEMDAVQTAQDGSFQATIPWTGGFFVELDAEGAVPTSFSAVAYSGAVEGGPGDTWTRTATALDSLRAEFAGCASADLDGAIVEGEIRVLLPVDDLDETPLVKTATVTVEDADGVAHAACYLDDQGGSAPDATVTGDTGRFAVFGLPPGVALVQMVLTVEETEFTNPTLPVRLPEGGAAPLYPLWAELPL